ncbi:hypothetical protein ACLI4Y_08785 [Natrialbaceae archaeon A-CW3]
MGPNSGAASRRLGTGTDHTGGESSTQSVLTPDDRFHVLQTSRRRDVLRYLHQAGNAVDIRDLTDWVAAREHETTPDQLNSSQRQRVYISLYQTHLPKLDEYRIVRYDKDRGTVEPTERIDAFVEYLEPTPDEPERQWWQPYLLVTGLGTVLVSTSATGVLSVAPAVISGVIVGLLALVTSVHALSETVLEGETLRSKLER